ncbi:cytochrome P450 [Micromonospora foliorum]|uniref:cytochrome P450 n=1 Tax=Micromonospora foliorum TaxID=2911210 RepID=UPI001EE7EDF4|nr:cytochrome P450 [Micromonospora foliorum]MCG5439830.1 cytochrome P450 [Micromonospora foliorum]
MNLVPSTDVAAIDLARIDLSDPALFADGDPHAVWQAMRQRDPVRWQAVDSTGFWAVSTFDGAERVLTDHATFSSTGGVVLNMLGRPEPAQGQQFSATDPPELARIRGPLQRELAMRAVQQHAAVVREHVRGLLGSLSGSFDFATAVSPLPMAFLGPLMGIPAQDWPLIARLVAMSVAEHDPDTAVEEGPQATLDRGHRELFAYLLNLSLEHRKRPRGDLVNALLALPISAGGVVANCYSLILGAAAAIAHVPTGTLAELLRTGQYPTWAARRAHIPGAVEEAIRWTSPAGHFLRTATRDTFIDGTAIAAGDAVVLWIGSSNRDERYFPDPHRLNPFRRGQRHLAFGAGAHYCIGAALARLALRIVFEEMFQRFSSFELAGDIVHVRSTWLAGIKSLPVVGRPR